MDTGSQMPHGDRPVFDAPPRRGSAGSQKNIWFIVGILGVVAVVIIGWIVFSRFSEGGESAESATSPEVFPAFSEPTPTPTPDVDIDKSTIKVEVLNGTGIVKEASFLQNKLGSLDYEEIETGNADSKDYDTARVTFYATFPEELKDELLDLLTDTYSQVKDTDSTGESDVDVRIITGLRPGIERPTPEPEVDENTEDSEATESSSLKNTASQVVS